MSSFFLFIFSVWKLFSDTLLAPGSVFSHVQADEPVNGLGQFCYSVLYFKLFLLIRKSFCPDSVAHLLLCAVRFPLSAFGILITVT